MKKIYIVLSLILILTFRYYYEHEDKMLDKALIYAKENRNELKKVLKYYKNGHYKIFCVNGNTGFRNESRIFYFIHLQNEEAYERKESSSA